MWCQEKNRCGSLDMKELAQMYMLPPSYTSAFVDSPTWVSPYQVPILCLNWMHCVLQGNQLSYQGSSKVIKRQNILYVWHRTWAETVDPWSNTYHLWFFKGRIWKVTNSDGEKVFANGKFIQQFCASHSTQATSVTSWVGSFAVINLQNDALFHLRFVLLHLTAICALRNVVYTFQFVDQRVLRI